MKTYFIPVDVENRHPITMETDPDFLLLLQRAALLGLKDAGYLTLMQHRQAEESLFRQHTDRVRSLHSKPNA